MSQTLPKLADSVDVEMIKKTGECAILRGMLGASKAQSLIMYIVTINVGAVYKMLITASIMDVNVKLLGFPETSINFWLYSFHLSYLV